MRGRWRQLMAIFARLRRSDPVPPAPIDPQAIRDQMRISDPEFARVSKAQHDALQVVAAQGIQDGLALRREREFWERQYGQ